MTNYKEKNAQSLFTQRLKRQRIVRELSQKDVADAIGVTKTTISLYEQGETVPDIKNLVKLADFLEVPCSYLLLKTNVATELEVSTSFTSELREAMQNFMKSVESYSKLEEEYQALFLTCIDRMSTLFSTILALQEGMPAMRKISLQHFHESALDLISLLSDMSKEAMNQYAALVPKVMEKKRYASKKTEKDD